jgi:hypothetical protein
MDRPEYMKMKADLFPPEFMDKYKLHDKVYIKVLYGYKLFEQCMAYHKQTFSPTNYFANAWHSGWIF